MSREGERTERSNSETGEGNVKGQLGERASTVTERVEKRLHLGGVMTSDRATRADDGAVLR